MNEISKGYFLGAGASYGHNENLQEPDRPPLAEQVFAAGWKKGILSSDDFEPLFQWLVRFLDDRGKLAGSRHEELQCDVELVLSQLEETFQQHAHDLMMSGPQVSPPTASSRDPQTVLSLCYYFLYELFRKYTNSFDPSESNYTKLAKMYSEEQFGVISLNYDAMFEKAIKHANRDFAYLPEDSQPDRIPIAKLHGSINLANDFGSAVSFDTDDFVDKVRHVHSNIARTGDVLQLDFDILEKWDYRELVFGSDSHLEPAIIPPLEKYKNYDKIAIYPKIWEFAETILNKIDELVIIGTSLTIQDQQLLELLNNCLADDVHITVVCGDKSESVRARLGRVIEDPTYNLEHTHFGDYIDSLS